MTGATADVEARAGSLDEEVRAAAGEYGVPEELLLAMGYVNTRWGMPPQRRAVGRAAAAGPARGAPRPVGVTGSCSSGRSRRGML